MSFTRHTLSGALELSDGTRLDLDVKGGRVALEEARSPYSQINVTVPLPDADTLEKLDPRDNLRAQFTVRQDFGQGGYARDFTAAFAGITHSRTHAWTSVADGSASTVTVDGVETRRNFITNPRFGAGLTSWSVTNVGTVRNVVSPGNYSMTLTPLNTNVTNYIRFGGNASLPSGLIAGRTYTMSGTITTPSTNTPGIGGNARRIGVQITGGTSAGLLTSPAGVAGQTSRVAVTFTMPSDATGLAFNLYNGYTNAATNPVTWSDLLLEESAGAGTYFDGSFGTQALPARASDVTAVYGGKRASAVSADYFEPWNSSFGVRPPTLRNFNVLLRTSEADHRAGELGLIFNTDEMLMQDFALMSQNAIAPLTSTVKGAVNLALSMVNAALSSDSRDASVDDVESLVWQPGVSAWDYVEPLVQKAGLRLYCDEQRIWRLTEPQRTVDGFLSLAASSNVTRGIDSVSLDARSEDSYYDGVVVKYEWQDAAKVRQIAYDIAGDPATARKVYTLTVNDVPYPGPGAARAILTRSQGRGRVLNVDAISDYTAEPGLPLGISLPGSITQTGFVSAVDWEFPEGVMSVKSRGLVETPPDSWTLTPPELVWSSVADDTTWANFPNIPISGGA